MGGWFLIVCISSGAICNIFMQMEFFDMQDCQGHRDAIIEQNPQVSYAECVKLGSE